MIKNDFKLDKRFLKTIRARYGKYEFRAGVLENKPHFNPRSKSRGLASVAGGPARKKSTKASTTVAEVGERLRVTHNVPYLTKPFKTQKNPIFRDFLYELGRLLTGASRSYSRVETRLRRIIREPILQKKYGRNTKETAKAKGFNRKLIDTGQFYRNIIAKVRVKR